MRHTLQNALDLGAEGVIVYCSTCINVARFTPHEALKRWRADADFWDMHTKARCRCGAKARKVEPAWPRRSRGGSPPLPIVPKVWGRLP